MKIIDNANKIVLEESWHSLCYGKSCKGWYGNKNDHHTMTRQNNVWEQKRKKIQMWNHETSEKKSPRQLMSVTGLIKLEHLRTLCDLRIQMYSENFSIKYETNIKENCIDQFEYQKIKL